MLGRCDVNEGGHEWEFSDSGHTCNAGHAQPAFVGRCLRIQFDTRSQSVTKHVRAEERRECHH